MNNKIIKISILASIILIVIAIVCLLVKTVMINNEQSTIEPNSSLNSSLNMDTNTYQKSNINSQQNYNSNLNSNYNMNSNTNTYTNDSKLVISPFHDVPTEKPIIYIYPTKTTRVSVKLGNPQYLSCTYPKYEDGWNVTANPDGTLTDLATGRNLYALYWEGKNLPKKTDMTEGFCVKGVDTAKFLEEKLETLGLNQKESEEFIIYWLPKMQNNKYNYIRFETIEEQNNAMPLTINPAPDNLIRIMMDWKGLKNKIEPKDQILKTPKREGYTVVEWGGSELR